jgi:DnaJ-class molecular chaperone
MIKSDCPACSGTGRKKSDSGKGHTAEDCAACGGTGRIFTEETDPEYDPFMKK